MNKSPKKRLTVLVVEDNPAQLEYIAYLLKMYGLNIIVASDGESAQKVLDGLKIDCALLDIHLGQGMNGIELMQILRKNPKYSNIPIISVTAYYTSDNKESFIDQGFTDFITKPFDHNQLNKALNDHLYSA